MIARGIAATLLGVLCALVVGCGSSGSSSGLLRSADASGLKASLDQVQQAVDARDVGACAARLQALRSKVSNLPSSVDASLRTRLRQEITGKLAPKVASECSQPKQENLPTVTEQVPTTTAAPTQTTPPPTTPTTTSTTETTPPPATTTTDTTPTDPGGAAPPETNPSSTDSGGFGPGSSTQGGG